MFVMPDRYFLLRAKRGFGDRPVRPGCYMRKPGVIRQSRMRCDTDAHEVFYAERGRAAHDGADVVGATDVIQNERNLFHLYAHYII